MSEADKGHVKEYDPPSGGDGDGSPHVADRSHVTPYTPPTVPKEPYTGPMDRGHVREYVAPVPDPADESPPTPEEIEARRRAKEIEDHAALVRKLQAEDRRKIEQERALQRDLERAQEREQ